MMADRGLAGRGGMHIHRMRAAARHPSRPPPATSMLQEEDSELNVMDFVETEYKSDTVEGEPGRPNLKQRKARAQPQAVRGKGRAAGRSRGKLKPPTEGGKPAHKRRKKKHYYKLEESCDSGTLAMRYPYATVLKSLCEKVGNSANSRDSLPTRIFSQLRHTEVHYPYASQLQALHRHAGARAGGASSPSTAEGCLDSPSRALEVARVMRNLRYPTTSARNSCREDTSAPMMPFSTLLLSIAKQEKAHSHSGSQATMGPGPSVGGIGEILRQEMPHSHRDDPPPSELSSASLLQKLSHSAERDLQATRGGRCLSETQLAVPFSSTESSHSEDDLDWQPTHQAAMKVSKDAAPPVKWKSILKKSIENETEAGQPNTSQGGLVATSQGARRARGTVKVGLQQCSEAARAKLLEFIISRQQSSPDKRGRRARKRAKVTRKKGKRKHTHTVHKHGGLWDAGLAEGQTTAVEGKDGLLVVVEPQSLLKEYLLKPAGEEVVPSENCDIPKLETNFLFSRLLQNFKSLAESNQPDEPSTTNLEASRGPSILRGMLAAGTAMPDPPEQFSPSDHQKTSSSSDQQHQQQQEAGKPTALKEPIIRVKTESEIEIKVECNEEEGDVMCKVECEEDGFECHVCHLQFSSLTDLSNHQVLFHCTEEPPAPASRRLLGCSVEGLARGVMQGKQPA